MIDHLIFGIWASKHMAKDEEKLNSKKESDPTIIISDNPEHEKYELLKEKLRYKRIF